MELTIHSLINLYKVKVKIFWFAAFYKRQSFSPLVSHYIELPSGRRQSHRAGFHHPSFQLAAVVLGAAGMQLQHCWNLRKGGSHMDLTSMGALVDPLSQPGTSISCWEQCDWKPRRQTQIQSQHLSNCHPQRPLANTIMFIAQFQSFVRISYRDLPEWQKLTSQPSTGSGGFLCCSLWLNCVFSFTYTALHDIIYHTLINITKLNKLTNPLKASYNSAAQKWKSQLWYKCGLIFWSFPLCMKLSLESLISQVCLSDTNIQITDIVELTDVPQH